jgi:chromosome segregation ATPase
MELVEIKSNSSQNMEKLGGQVESLEKLLTRFGEDKKVLSNEVNLLNQRISTLSQQLTEANEKNLKLKQDLDMANAQLMIRKTSDDVYESIRQEKKQAEAAISKLAEDNQLYLSKMSQLEVHLIAQSQKELKTALTQNEKLQLQGGQISNLKRDYENLKRKCLNLEKNNIELKEHTITMEQLLCVKEDVYAQLNETQHLLQNSRETINKLEEASKKTQSIIEYDADKIFELEKIIVYLKNSLKDKDSVSAINLFFSIF